MRRSVPVLAYVVLSLAALRAAQTTLSLREIDEAILIGQTRIAADRARFHTLYRFPISQAPVDYVDVITPFRRVVLAADERAQIGDRSFGQRQAVDLLKTADGRVDFLVELTFHPLNTFIGVPAYDVVLLRSGQPVLPVSIDRQPRFGARVDGLPSAAPVATPRLGPGPAQPMLGGTIITRFAGDALDTAGAMDLLISDQGKALARVRIDLGKLR